MADPQDDLNWKNWTDLDEQKAWVDLRHQSQQTVFDVPPEVARAAVDRLHDIIRNEPARDAISAVLALAKLAGTTTSIYKSRSEILRTHGQAAPSVSTAPDDVFSRQLMEALYARSAAETTE